MWRLRIGRWAPTRGHRLQAAEGFARLTEVGRIEVVAQCPTGDRLIVTDDYGVRVILNKLKGGAGVPPAGSRPDIRRLPARSHPLTRCRESRLLSEVPPFPGRMQSACRGCAAALHPLAPHARSPLSVQMWDCKGGAAGCGVFGGRWVCCAGRSRIPMVTLMPTSTVERGLSELVTELHAPAGGGARSRDGGRRSRKA